MDLATLTKGKIGGVPKPIVIVAGAAAAYYLWSRSGSSAAAADPGAVDATTMSTDQPTGDGAFAGTPGSVSYTTVTKNTYVKRPPRKHKKRPPKHGNGPRRTGGGRGAGTRQRTTAGRRIARRR